MDTINNPAELALNDHALRQWLKADDPDGEMLHLRRALQKAIREELTDREKLYLSAYYVDRKTQVRIAVENGVDKSTVSRGLSRARRKLARVLQYCSPRLMGKISGRRTNNREV